MLKYFVQLTLDLTAAGIIVGMLYGYIRSRFDKPGKYVMWIGGGVSIALAFVFAAVKHNTKINIGTWNLITFWVFVGLVILFILLSITPLRRLLRAVGDWIHILTVALLMVTLAFYILPDVLLYPWEFDLQGNSVFSTEFLYRLIGCILGALLVLIIGVAAYQCIRRLHPAPAKAFLYAVLTIESLSFIGKCIQIMITRRMIRQTPFLFTIIKITLNYSKYFIFAILICAAIIAVVQFIRNTRVMGAYENPAQLRKIRSGMRRQRRWSATFILFAVIAVVNMTVVDAYNNKKPELSPVEDSPVENGNVVVDLTRVDDGHLHRFAYETENGVQVRFIVIKKPNSTSYGVGLDACDICGEAGYFERDGQIVCKKCDVVMNIRTIGFKGGCNPIVIDYTVEDGRILVPVSELVKNEREFKG